MRAGPFCRLWPCRVSSAWRRQLHSAAPTRPPTRPHTLLTCRFPRPPPASCLQADLIGDEKETKAGRRRREALHRQWAEAKDAKELQAVLKGLKQGFRRRGRGGFMDDEVRRGAEAMARLGAHARGREGGWACGRVSGCWAVVGKC